MKKKVSLYGTSQATLYTACEQAWTQCHIYLPQFAAFRTVYTTDYIAAAVDAVKAARDLPKATQNVTGRKDARVALIEATKIVRSDWQQLKLYINASFTTPFVQGKLEKAGSDSYNEASFHHWNSVKTIIEMASVFIKENEEVLINKGGMPQNFPETFITDSATCITLYNAFIQANIDKQKGTGNKISANNSLYALTISMLRDGSHIFRKDENLKKMSPLATSFP